MIMRQYRQICVLLMLFAAGGISHAGTGVHLAAGECAGRCHSHLTIGACAAMIIAIGGCRCAWWCFTTSTAWLNAGEYAVVSVLQRAEGYLGGRPDVAQSENRFGAPTAGTTSNNLDALSAWHFAIFMYRIR